MKTSDIIVGKFYCIAHYGLKRAKVLETGVKLYPYSKRHDGVRIELEDGSTRRVSSREIKRLWTDEDDEKIRQRNKRENRRLGITEEFKKRGFKNVRVSLTPMRKIGGFEQQDRLAITFSEADADKAMQAIFEKMPR